MLKLFKVKHKDKKGKWKIEYFDNKMNAKQFRNKHPGTHVALGPDHRGTHGTPGRRPWRKRNEVNMVEAKSIL